MTTFGAYKMLRPGLLDAISDFVKDNIMFMKFENLADITVLFSMYVPKASRQKFYQENIHRILSNVPYATDEVFFKFLWSFSRTEELQGADMITFEDVFIKNHVQFSNKLFI